MFVTAVCFLLILIFLFPSVGCPIAQRAETAKTVAFPSWGGYRILEKEVQDTDLPRRSPVGESGGILPRKIFYNRDPRKWDFGHSETKLTSNNVSFLFFNFSSSIKRQPSETHLYIRRRYYIAAGCPRSFFNSFKNVCGRCTCL